MVAYFQQISYYAVPLWNSGEPQTTTSYKTEQRRMQFRGVLPNPVERIIRAACQPWAAANTGLIAAA